MALWVCRGCTTRFAPGADRCPHCGVDDHFEQGSEEDQVAKISAAGGPTIEGVPGLDHQSDRVEDQLAAPEGGRPSVADRIEQASAGGDSVPAGKSDTGDYAEVEDYSDWSYGELQAECKERGLTATGDRGALESRIQADDRQRAGG